MAYFPEKEVWSVKEIIDELDMYDKLRMFEFFDRIHIIENKINSEAEESNSLQELKNDKGNPSFKKYLNFKYLKNEDSKQRFSNLEIGKISISKVDEDLRVLYLLAKIRNKFSHNQYLSNEDFDYLKSLIPLNEGEKIASYMNRTFNELLKTTT